MQTFPARCCLLVLFVMILLTPLAHGQSPARNLSTDEASSSKAQQQFDGLLQRTVESEQIAGAVALLIRDGQVSYFGAKGLRDVETGKAMQTDSLFQIASMSKPVTSVAVMILVDDGRLKVTDPVSKYLPEFKNPKVLVVGEEGEKERVAAHREITIHDLLTHTSGLTYRFIAQQPFAGL